MGSPSNTLLALGTLELNTSCSQLSLVYPGVEPPPKLGKSETSLGLESSKGCPSN